MSQPLWIGCIWLMSLATTKSFLPLTKEKDETVQMGIFVVLRMTINCVFTFMWCCWNSCPLWQSLNGPKVGFHVKQVVAQITREVPPESSTLVEISLHKMSTGGGGPLSCFITIFALTFFATLVKTQEADVQCFDVTGDFVFSWAKVGFGVSLAKYFVNATRIWNFQW